MSDEKKSLEASLAASKKIADDLERGLKMIEESQKVYEWVKKFKMGMLHHNLPKDSDPYDAYGRGGF